MADLDIETIEDEKTPLGMRAEQRERTRAAILESAVKMFAEVGFDAAQTRTIAERAGANHGLVHYYYSSKLDLWKACVEYLFERAAEEGIFDDLAPAEEQGDYLKVFRSLIRTYVRLYAHHPEYPRILFDEGRRPGPRLKWITDILKPHHEQVQNLLKHMEDCGYLPEVSTIALQYMILGMTNSVFTLAPYVQLVSGEKPLEDDFYIDEQVRMVELFLFRGVDPAVAGPPWLKPELPAGD